MLAQETHMPKSFLTKTTHFCKIPEGKHTHESTAKWKNPNPSVIRLSYICILLDWFVSDAPNLKLGYSR